MATTSIVIVSAAQASYCEMTAALWPLLQAINLSASLAGASPCDEPRLGALMANRRWPAGVMNADAYRVSGVATRQLKMAL